jgi:hypothetical protein
MRTFGFLQARKHLPQFIGKIVIGLEGGQAPQELRIVLRPDLAPYHAPGLGGLDFPWVPG